MDAIIETYFAEVASIANKVPWGLVSDMAIGLQNLRNNKGRLFLLGVGGSAANCSHAVNDFRKLCEIEAYSPTDNTAELTARVNDSELGWDTFFLSWLEVSNLNHNDALLIMSVGGGNPEPVGQSTPTRVYSENLIQAIRLARMKRASVWSIVGRKDGYAANNSDISIVVPVSKSYPGLLTPLTESFQAVIWHCLVSHPRLAINKTVW